MEADEDIPPLTPQNNLSLFGQEEAEAQFLGAWNSGRLPHAWIFSGPPGIGKATLAYRIARFVLSEKGESDGGGLFGEASGPVTSLAVDADERVSKLVANEGHPDLHILRRQINEKTGKMSAAIRVDEVRAFEHALHLKSREGGWRVAIVDGAETLNRNAENALLKTLEEPPAKALILLTANTLNALLPTTLSRCRRVALSPLSNEVMDQLLAQLGVAASAKDRAITYHLSEGSIGRAISLIEGGGVKAYKDSAALFSKLPKINAEAIHSFAATYAKRPKEGEADLFATVSEMIELWMERLIRRIGGDTRLQEILPGEFEQAAEIAQKLGVEEMFRRRDEVLRLLRLEGALNLDRKQVLMDVAFTLSRA